MVGVVDGRCKERVADSLAPVLPSVVYIVVVVVVAAGDLVVDGGSMVPVDRTGLVFHIKELIQDI